MIYGKILNLNNLYNQQGKNMIDFFGEAFLFTVGNEGDYVNNPDDRGGETYMGIARNFHPSWPGWKIIDDAKEHAGHLLSKPPQKPPASTIENLLKHTTIKDSVSFFYKKNFWEPLQLSKLYSRAIAIKIFDMAVNLGAPRASSIVQNCLNIMNFADGYELKVDNVIGALTIKLINEKTKKGDENYLLNLLTIQQGYIYMKLSQNNPAQKEFIHGWINRLHMTVKL